MTGADDAARLLRDYLVWDAHSGFMPDPAADLANLAIWRDAGVDFLSVNVGFDLLPWEAAVRTIAAFGRWIELNERDYRLARRFQDIECARADGRMAIAFDLEGMIALDQRIEMVGLYRELGVRQILFAYNRNNAAGGGCHDDDAGLTAFGRQVIEEMNRVGMTVDVSHAGYRTSMEAMEASATPVVFSHSNPASVHRHGRNIVDEQIRACAATGGVVGAAGISLFIGADACDTGRFADHIDYLLDVAGPDHVGLGLDFGFPVDVADVDAIVAANPEFWPPEEGYYGPIGYFAPGQLLELVEILLRRGHPEPVIAGVLGANFHRVARETWK